jgi:hypothetical protein
MLMKPAMRGGEVPPVKNVPGCCWGPWSDEVGTGSTVVVVVVGARVPRFNTSADTVEIGVTVLSPSPANNRLEEGKEEDMAGGQGDGRRRLASLRGT